MSDEIEHTPQNLATAEMQPHGTVMRVKTAKGFAWYELTAEGWRLLREQHDGD